MRTVIAVLGLLMLFAAAGCNHDSSSASGPFAITVETQDANGVSSDDFASAQQITFTMTAKNISSQSQTFNIQTCFGATAYAVLKQGTAHVVAGGYMAPLGCNAVAQGGTPVTLAPGQSFNTSTTWLQGTTGGQPMPPGTYSVVAGIACVQSDACMPASSSDTAMLPLGDSTIYRSAAVSFTINP